MIDREMERRAPVESFCLHEGFLRALKHVRPEYLLVENVKGMPTAEDGAFFRYQLEGFKEAGYTVFHALLNARGYGVAQSRKRVFIAGVREDLPAVFEFPDASHGRGCAEEHRTLEDVIGEMALWPEGEYCAYRFSRRMY